MPFQWYKRENPKLGKTQAVFTFIASQVCIQCSLPVLTSTVLSSLRSISDTDVGTKQLTGIKGEGSMISWSLLTSRSCNTGIHTNLQTLPSLLKQSITSPLLSSMHVHFLSCTQWCWWRKSKQNKKTRSRGLASL